MSGMFQGIVCCHIGDHQMLPFECLYDYFLPCVFARSNGLKDPCMCSIMTCKVRCKLEAVELHAGIIITGRLCTMSPGYARLDKQCSLYSNDESASFLGKYYHSLSSRYNTHGRVYDDAEKMLASSRYS